MDIQRAILYIQTDRQVDIHMKKKSCLYRQVDGQIDRQIYIQMDIQVDMQMDVRGEYSMLKL